MIHALMSAAHQARIRYGKRKTHFLGEVAAADFITGNALASAIGLTAGTALNSNEPWLHFEIDGKTLYVAKKIFRHTVSWNHINARGAVFGTATVVIQGKTYKVRLLKGANSDPTPAGAGYDQEKTWGSEWNRLFYPLVPNTAQSAQIPTYPISGEGILFGGWANYTDAQLDISNRYMWCQETNVDSAGQRVLRGIYGLSYLSFNASSVANSNYGWRPVLELVE